MVFHCHDHRRNRFVQTMFSHNLWVLTFTKAFWKILFAWTGEREREHQWVASVHEVEVHYLLWVMPSIDWKVTYWPSLQLNYFDLLNKKINQKFGGERERERDMANRNFLIQKALESFRCTWSICVQLTLGYAFHWFKSQILAVHATEQLFYFHD